VHNLLLLQMISTCAHLLVSVVVNRKDLECTEAGCRPAGPLTFYPCTYLPHPHTLTNAHTQHAHCINSHRHTINPHKVPSCLTKSRCLAKPGCLFTKQALSARV